jgi:hypothetical protein
MGDVAVGVELGRQAEEHNAAPSKATHTAFIRTILLRLTRRQGSGIHLHPPVKTRGRLPGPEAPKIGHDNIDA